MALEFKLPELGENIESGDVVSVLVEVGATVSAGDSLIEIEAGKASMEIPSPFSGGETAQPHNLTGGRTRRKRRRHGTKSCRHYGCRKSKRCGCPKSCKCRKR